MVCRESGSVNMATQLKDKTATPFLAKRPVEKVWTV